MKLNLNRSFPLLQTTNHGWCCVGVMSVIFTAMIFVQQPFGISTMAMQHKWLILSGFGWIYALVKVCIYFVGAKMIPAYIDSETWSIKNEIVTLLVLFITVGFLNWIYTLYALSGMHASWQSFMDMQCYTFEFGIIPTFGFKFYVESRNLKIKLRNDKPEESLTGISALEPGMITANTTLLINGLTIEVPDILYIHANENYVDIYFLRNGQLEKQMQRSTIKLIQSRLVHFPYIMQCHKSYLVNINKINEKLRNKNGFRLILQHKCLPVPVSRKYVPLFKK